MLATHIRKFYFFSVLLLLGLAGLYASCQTNDDLGYHTSAITSAEALPGAIFTTLEDGTRVNKNIYESKLDVYLDGGPGPNAPVFAAGLPEGDYYFQVTDPSGKDLLSSDHISCRKFHVNQAGVMDGVYAGTNYAWQRGDWVAEECQHATGMDVDHTDDGAITVQLYPYDDTPNKGGVYKVWVTPVEHYAGNSEFVPEHARDAVNGENWLPANVHGFIPAHSKTDNFKVKKPGKPYYPPVLTIRKFHDRNLDSVQGEGEETISGWLVTVTDPTGSSNNYFTTATVTPLNEGIWYVVEDTPEGSAQTASYLDGVLLSAYPAADPEVEVAVEGVSEEVHEVVYGNVGLGRVAACKGYDSDGDGQLENGPVVAGWRFELVGVTALGPVGPVVQTTDETGCTTFASLIPGTYTVTELFPTGDGWVTTGPVIQTVTIESVVSDGKVVGTAVELWFTNRCLGYADFGTKGYWHNKNGLDELGQTDINYVNSLAPYAQPSTYFGAGDEPFDGMFEDGTWVPSVNGTYGELIAPAGTAKAEISHFLVDANAGGDPREQLAQQLLAYTFNVLHRLEGLNTVIVLPNGSDAMAGDLIDNAIDAWFSGSAADQNAIAGLLDALNNNNEQPFVHAQPCEVIY